MRKSDTTFAELRKLLLTLGFRDTLDKTRMRFVHPASGTILLFRAYQDNENVNPRDMLVVCRQLVDNGLIDENAFNHFLQKASA